MPYSSCAACQLGHSNSLVFYHMYIDFSLSSQNKNYNLCERCQIIHDGVLQHVRRDRPVMKEEIVRAIISGNSIQILCSKSSLSNGGCQELEIYELPDYDPRKSRSTPLHSFKISPHIVPNLELESALGIISPWLSGCRASHREECADASELSIPDRLLDVKQCVSKNQILLVESRTIDQARPIEYTTLSHCWGSAQFIKTNLDNYSAHANGIDLSTLPRTFRDVVLLTHRLNIQYIWIDSICIIQDDVADWERQSALMADIYSGSLLNIAAAHGRDSQTGLFNTRFAQLHAEYPGSRVQKTIPPFEELKILDKTGLAHRLEGSGPFFIRPSLSTTHDRHSLFHGSGKSMAPLNTRGWVYQERILSPRTISFYATELIWECRMERWCECTRISELPKRDPAMIITRDGARIRSLLCRGNEQQLNKILDDWYSNIENYAVLQLTKEEDRLPALSGIASRTYEALNQLSKSISSQGSEDLQGPQYVAGLWKIHNSDGSLSSRGFLWYFFRGTRSLKRSKRFVAPTWSWASVVCQNTDNGRAMNTFYTSNQCADNFFIIEDVSCVVEGVNPYGAVSSGKLRVGGKLMLAGDVRDFYTEDHILKSNLGEAVSNHSTKQYYEEGDLDVDGWQPEYGHGETYMLQVSHQKQTGWEPRGIALILQRVKENNISIGGDSKFRRIGLTQLHSGLDPFESVKETTSITII
ncbi:putative het domain-containing protein [Botrytis fragariae]|uniref:Putative het domain-containing protein n=1 Tax=Botrytis fragariae TaxID=1964551 RepID=A0A8H6B1N9_9HELO|nr:putative het domain-containing protein [Botrytis fragariae]KAF5877808.1 putative het domain-containing protein [Botrytis fragariae]